VSAISTDATSGRSHPAVSSLPTVALAALLFGYVAWRSLRLAITWDEAANYLEYTRKGFLSPFWFPFPHFGANNHFLNTWLTFLTTRVAGPTELSLRAPVLAAHLLYLYYTARLSGTFRSSLDAVCAFGVLNLNPYLLDFFSLSRGYGLSYGLLAGSLWHLHQYLGKEFDPRHGRFALTFAVLAVSAHLTLVHFLLALVGVIVVAPVVGGPRTIPQLRRLRAGLRANRVALVGVGLFLLPTLVVIRRLERAGAFFYGGRTGFWEDTVVSMMERSLYQQRPGVSHLLGLLCLLVVGSAVLAAARRWPRRQSAADLYLPALLALLMSCVLASIAQHHLLGVLYLTGRTALYLLVLWTFVLVVLLRELGLLNPAWRYGLRGAAALLALHLVASANGRYVLEWKSGAEVREVIQVVAARRGTLPTGKPTVDLGAGLEYEAPLNYYRAAAGLSWLNVVDRHARASLLNDFYLFSEQDWRGIAPDSFTVVRMYPLSGARLLQRRVRPARYLIARSISGLPAAAQAADSSWSVTLPVDFSSAPASRSMIAMGGAVWLERVGGTRAEVAIRFRRGDSSYSWCGASLQDFAVKSRTWYPLHLSCFVPAEAQDGDSMTASVDHRDTPIQLRRATVEWLTAED
jgi:hypothetical protein